MNKKKQLREQRGISFLEFMFTVIVSLPCIVFVQDRVIDVFDSVITKNVLSSYKEMSYYIEDSPMWESFVNKNKSFVKLDISDILSNKFFKIGLSDDRMQFYAKSDGIIHSDGVQGYYIIGVLSKPSTQTYSPVLINSILGSNAGYIKDGYVYSFNGAFAPVNIHDDPVLNNIDQTKENVVFYDFFFKNKNASKDPFLKADSVSISDQSESDKINYIDCQADCLNKGISFTWFFSGITDNSIYIDKVNGLSIEQPIKIYTPQPLGIYNTSVSQLLSTLKILGYLPSDYADLSIGFGISGVDSEGKEIYSSFDNELHFIKG